MKVVITMIPTKMKAKTDNMVMAAIFPAGHSPSSGNSMGRTVEGESVKVGEGTGLGEGVADGWGVGDGKGLIGLRFCDASSTV